MTKYCAINLNVRCSGVNFKYSRDDTYVLSKENVLFFTAYAFALTLLY